MIKSRHNSGNIAKKRCTRTPQEKSEEDDLWCKNISVPG